MGDRSFFNGKTGREEVWLWHETTDHELGHMRWTETNWYVTDIDAYGRANGYPTQPQALEDYEQRVKART